MTLFFHWGLAWLAAIPALVWLWRLAASRHRLRVPSLVPFESLLRRPPRRRTRVVLTSLFWWQLAALLVVILALLQPAMWSRPRRTILAVVDTSASMATRQRGGSAFARAQRELRARLRRRRGGDHVLLVTTAPVAAPTARATSDHALLGQAAGSLRVSDLSGNLASAAHIGRALLGRAPDATWVFTDEPAPGAPGEGVTFVSVGEPRANTALVGLDAQGPLCGAGTDLRLVASVERFAARPAAARLSVRQEGRAIAQASFSVGPGAPRSVPIALPSDTRGWVDVALSGPDNHLAADDRAWTFVRGPGMAPVVVAAHSVAVRAAVGRWLQACEGLTWRSAERVRSERGEGADGSTEPFLLVTDGPGAGVPGAAGVLRLEVPGPSDPVRLARWLIESPHPVAAYLSPLAGAASLIGPRVDDVSGSEEPVVWGLAGGRRVPLVLVGEHDGQRTVTMRMDPVRQAEAAPQIVAFFNSLRWLMAHQDTQRTGEVLATGRLSSGPVVLTRPDGRQERLAHPGGILRYEATTHAGLYRLSQGATSLVRAVNFADPAESNVFARASTWQPLPRTEADQADTRVAQPLAAGLLRLALILLLAEWWLYTAKGRQRAASAGMPQRATWDAGQARAAGRPAERPAAAAEAVRA